MNIRIFVSAATLGMLLQGCATMSGEECLVSDWRTIGYEDGSRGQAADRIGQHRQACAKHGISPDLAAYQAGRAKGLKEFCQPDNGFHIGSKGQTYRGVCPEDLADEFVASYRRGRHLYELENNVRSVTNQLSAKRRRLERIDEDLLNNGTRVITEETTSAERIEIVSEIRKLAEERGRVDTEIPELVKRKAMLEEELVNYRGQLATNYQ